MMSQSMAHHTHHTPIHTVNLTPQVSEITLTLHAGCEDTNSYSLGINVSIISSISCLIYENGEKCGSVFHSVQEDVLKCVKFGLLS